MTMRTMILHPGRQRVILAALLIVASTFVLFSGALNNDFIGWDDEFYVLANPYIAPLTPAMSVGSVRVLPEDLAETARKLRPFGTPSPVMVS